MSTVNDSITVSVPLSTAIKAFRAASRSFGSCIEHGDNMFSIKDTTQRTNWSSTNPATVTVSFRTATNGTDVFFESKNFGFGPIQSRECASRLGAVKAALLDEIDRLSAQNDTQMSSVADELLKYKQLLDMGVLSQEKFETKKKELL